MACVVACSGAEFRADREFEVADSGSSALPTPDEEPTGEGPKGDPDKPGEVATPCVDGCAAEGGRECDPAAPASMRACVRQASGCLDWTSSPCLDGVTDCASGKDKCLGSCPPPGKSPCDQAGKTKCDGGKLFKCEVQSGCLVWDDGKACDGGKTCIGDSCQTTCSSNCSSVGAKQCVAGTTNFQTCNTVQANCNQWTGTTSCGSGKVCTGAGQCCAASTCKPEWNNLLSCGTNGDSVWKCQQVNGCWDWVFQKACNGFKCDSSTKACCTKCKVGDNACVTPSQWWKCEVPAGGSCGNWGALRTCATSDACYVSLTRCTAGQ